VSKAAEVAEICKKGINDPELLETSLQETLAIEELPLPV
jgi:hypothetical protein